MDNAKTLLTRLEACVTTFDPLADHEHGTAQPRKVALVPVDLFDDLKGYLKKAV